jgi:hypothetical protein
MRRDLPASRLHAVEHVEQPGLDTERAILKRSALWQHRHALLTILLGYLLARALVAL